MDGSSVCQGEKFRVEGVDQNIGIATTGGNAKHPIRYQSSDQNSGYLRIIQSHLYRDSVSQFPHRRLYVDKTLTG